MDRRMHKIHPVFYRTLSPLGPIFGLQGPNLGLRIPLMTTSKFGFERLPNSSLEMPPNSNLWMHPRFNLKMPLNSSFGMPQTLT